MRISPTAKIAMLTHGITEKDLPKEKENMVINRDFFMNLLKRGLGKSTPEKKETKSKKILYK